MFIKINVKTSDGDHVPVMINTAIIQTIEPALDGRAIIIPNNGNNIVAVESFDKVVTLLRIQGLYEV